MGLVAEVKISEVKCSYQVGINVCCGNENGQCFGTAAITFSFRSTPQQAGKRKSKGEIGILVY